MTTEVLKNCKLWLDGYSLSGYLNAIAIEYGAEMLDATTFGNDTKINAGGIKTVTAQHEGYWDSEPDGALFGMIGVSDKPMTACPQTGVVGDVAYFFLSNLAEYSPGAAHGELFSFSVSAESTGKLVRGEILINGSALAASGNGTARQLGAASSAQKLYAALHVTAVDGTLPTLDVVVQSDDAEAFTTATDRITFTQATDIGSEFKELAGAITDTWYRISYAIAGTSPQFTFAVAVGIR